MLKEGVKMYTFEDKINIISEQYHALKSNPELGAKRAMPGKAYFLDNNDVLSIPRDDGDCRYPYGQGGFNFWAYTSGYMHSNEGLFSTFIRALEGQEPKIAFFAGLPKGQGKYSLVSLLSVPILFDDEGIEIERYTVFSPGAAYYITEFAGIRTAIRAFANEKKEIHFTLHIKNMTDKIQKLFISDYINPFLRHAIFEDVENRYFREVQALKPEADQGELGSFLFRINEDIDRKTSVSNFGVLHRNIRLGDYSKLQKHEETTSRYQYVGGARSSLHTPFSLKKGTFGEPKHVCTLVEIAAACDILHLEIGAGDSARLDLSLVHLIYCRDDSLKEKLLSMRFNPDTIDKEQNEIDKSERSRLKGLTALMGKATDGNFKEGIFNSFFEHLKKQVEFCATIKGYILLWENSLIGIRDVFQAIEGYLLWQPEEARAKMLEALNFIAPNGRCPRQYTLPVGDKMPVLDLRAFIDQGVWVISTITTYLRLTRDFDFLKEVCGYYEIVDEKSKKVRKSEVENTVLEHMFKIMDYLLENRDHESTGCVRALFGDWNDALDGLGVTDDPGKEYGTGVSVMVTLQVYQNLAEMIEILEQLDPIKYAANVDRYKREREDLEECIKKYAVVQNEKGEKRIVHGWGDKRKYFVGSFCDPDGQSRNGLVSNAFWVNSGLYEKDTSVRDIILDSFKSLDSKYGLKTFEPYFPSDIQGVGRIKKLPAGTYENGASYCHATAFGIMAQFRMGRAKEAWEQIYKAIPITHDIVTTSPYIMPNTYGNNEEKLIDGESVLDWQTGSSNVILKTLVRYGVGLEPQFGGIWIQPPAWLPFESFDFKIKVRSCEVSISYKNKGSGKRIFEADGIRRESRYDQFMGIEKLWVSDEELKGNRLEIKVLD
jgi:cellobiose phosphorylase